MKKNLFFSPSSFFSSKNILWVKKTKQTGKKKLVLRKFETFELSKTKLAVFFLCLYFLKKQVFFLAMDSIINWPGAAKGMPHRRVPAN